MSAPTSLTLNSKEQQAAICGLYSSCQLKTSIGELSSISENGKTSPSSKSMMGSSSSLSPHDKLIETKFNELARKILDELKQAQYSRDFFKNVDDIIKEPISKTFITKSSATSSTRSRRPIHQQRYMNNYTSRQQAKVDQFQYSNDQPRSLPLDVTHIIQQQHLKQQQQQQQQQLLQKQQLQQKQQSPQRQQKSAIPTINGLNGYSSPKKGVVNSHSFANDDKASQNNGSSYPINRSSTIGEANLKRKQQQQQLQQPQQQQQLVGLKKSSTVIHNNNNNIANNNNHDVEHAKMKANDANITDQRRGGSQKNPTDLFSKLVNRRSIDDDDDDNDDDDDDDDDEEEEDDDDDDEEDDDGYNEQRENRQRNINTAYQNQRFNPIAKSKTLSDTTNISEMNMLSKKGVGTRLQPVQHQSQQQQQQQQQTQKLRQRFNPIVRSNTITSSASQRANHQERELNSQNSSEPKSMVLSSKDIGSLYKPHMNYSTSVLGTHRLSDDDEIIIIPTQSPSLVSTSPDGDANVDELTERFSISRTKSFWEKLSKGSHSRRSINENARCDNVPGASTVAVAAANIKINQNQTTSNGNKVNKMGARMNGQTHTLDRMDSTGGSNSNYSCSSSGDENSACHSQQNAATVGQLQEMSRQNRFRQTR